MTLNGLIKQEASKQDKILLQQMSPHCLQPAYLNKRLILTPAGSLDGDDSTESGDGMSSEDMAAFATRMNAMVASKPVMTGQLG